MPATNTTRLGGVANSEAARSNQPGGESVAHHYDIG